MSIEIIPQAVGEYIKAVNSDVWLCRIKIIGDIPHYALKINENECVIGISPKCPHMGCKLFPVENIPQETLDNALVRCPCHSSCFDLLAQGKTIMGPATEWLPVMQLNRVEDDPGKVELAGWVNSDGATDIGRGIPYGETSIDIDVEEG